jgi:hypothetical protein
MTAPCIQKKSKYRPCKFIAFVSNADSVSSRYRILKMDKKKYVLSLPKNEL